VVAKYGGEENAEQRIEVARGRGDSPSDGIGFGAEEIDGCGGISDKVGGSRREQSGTGDHRRGRE
jgi:hypothetical protein